MNRNRTRQTTGFFGAVAIAVFLTAVAGVFLLPLLGQMAGSVASLAVGIAVGRVLKP